MVSGPCTVSGTTLTPTGAGTCVVSATKAADSTYASATSTNTVSVTVGLATQAAFRRAGVMPARDLTVVGTRAEEVGFVGAIHAARNGFYYALDRVNGAFIAGKQYVDELNWTTGLDPKTGQVKEWPIPVVKPAWARVLVNIAAISGEAMLVPPPLIHEKPAPLGRYTRGPDPASALAAIRSTVHRSGTSSNCSRPTPIPMRWC